MKNPKLSTLILAAVFLAVGSAAKGQLSSVALDVPGVPGEYNHALHKGLINVTGFAWSVTAPTNNNRAVFSPLVITKGVDEASPPLARQCAKMTSYDTIHVYGVANSVDYQTLDLYGATLVGDQQSEVGGALVETISFDVENGEMSGDSGQESDNFQSFLYLSGWGGGTTLLGQTDWIGVDECAFQMASTKTAGPTPSVTSDIVLTRRADNDSGNIEVICQLGIIIPYAVIESYFNAVDGARVWQHIYLTNVTIDFFGEQYQQCGPSSNSIAETERLHCDGKMIWSYAEPATGSGRPDTFTAGWDAALGPLPYSAFATVTTVQATTSGLSVTWPGVAGATYNVLGSSSVNGPYRLSARVMATNTALQSVTFSNTANSFFYVAQLPFH